MKGNYRGGFVPGGRPLGGGGGEMKGNYRHSKRSQNAALVEVGAK